MDAEDETGGSFELPGFAAGGRVDRTGIALVHEGEYIVPAPGSEAAVSPAATGAGADAGPVVNYHFPVEIQAVGSLPESESAQLVGQVFDQLGRELAGRL
ncbi:hypothetical protein [Streptomyces geranii]|uniref:hypothetical protein n=1 Tax=Streptomyces geranii TaxID=2058923 RepID=UPI000D03BE22|nr:hypothetical protein [Streptomyces geranii]